MPEEKKRNESKALGRCPQGTDVGLFGKSTDFVDSFVAGFIYAAACEELVKQTLEINQILETMSEAEKSCIPNLEQDMVDLAAKWVLATAMFGIDA